MKINPKVRSPKHVKQKLSKESKKMYISQCIIAKNEEANIELCLSHLKPVVDEQIVIDTGSTDRTVELAEKLGAKVFHFDWIDDFSAARNFALDKAKGDWIIFLDCDEYFSEDSVTFIKDIIKKYDRNKNTEALICELINLDPVTNRILSTTKNSSPRIFKRKSYIRYIKRIHEILQNVKDSPINPSLIDVSDLLKVFHTGYSKEAKKEKDKDERNLSLLNKEIEEIPDDSKWNLYYAKQLNSAGKYEESLKYAFLARKYMNSSITLNYYFSIYSLIMVNMISIKKPYEEIKEIFDEAVIKYPQFPDYYMFMGTVALKERKINEAIDLFEKCIYYCEKYTGIEESYSYGHINEIYDNLLSAYVIAGNKHNIVKTSIAILNTNKYNIKVLTILLNTFLTQEKEESIIIFMKKLYDYKKSKDKIYLLKASEITKNKNLINYYKKLLNNEELKVVENLIDL